MPADMASLASTILVTGPTRSGKSEWAEQLAHRTGANVTYIATAQPYPDDPDWAARIQQHRQRRPPTWQLQEVPRALPDMITAASATDCLLIDSLGTWTANLLEFSLEDWQAACQDLLGALCQTPSQVILVAEETGWGVVPAYPLGRQFRDRLGHLTRQVGSVAEQVYLVVAGYAVDLRSTGQPVTFPPVTLSEETSAPPD